MEEKTKLISSKAPADQAKTIITEVAKSSKFPKLTKVAGITGAGAVAGLGIFGLMSMAPPPPMDENGNPVDLDKPEMPENPVQATGVSNEMSFSEAFKTARQEVGADGFFEYKGKVYGTMYETELAQLSPEEQKQMYNNIMNEYNETHETTDVQTDPAIIIHENAPVAVGVTDDMSFKDAFAVARAEVGPGGTFDWKGSTFNTYTKEEFTAMTDDQKTEFLASTDIENIELPTISSSDVDILKIDGIEEVVANETTSSNLIYEDYITDPETGENVLVGLFDVDGELVIKVDTDGIGGYDTYITQSENGDYLVSNDAGESVTLTQADIESYQENEIVYYTDDMANTIDGITYPTNNIENEGTDDIEKLGTDVMYSTNDTDEINANYDSDFDNNANTFMS